jgi:hypothetical protein
VVPEFLLAIGVNSSQFRNAKIRRNEAAGHLPLAWPVHMRSIGRTGKRLKWLQAIRCKAELANYLEETDWRIPDTAG